MHLHAGHARPAVPHVTCRGGRPGRVHRCAPPTHLRVALRARVQHVCQPLHQVLVQRRVVCSGAGVGRWGSGWGGGEQESRQRREARATWGSAAPSDEARPRCRALPCPPTPGSRGAHLRAWGSRSSTPGGCRWAPHPRRRSALPLQHATRHSTAHQRSVASRFVPLLGFVPACPACCGPAGGDGRRARRAAHVHRAPGMLACMCLPSAPGVAATQPGTVMLPCPMSRSTKVGAQPPRTA